MVRPSDSGPGNSLEYYQKETRFDRGGEALDILSLVGVSVQDHKDSHHPHSFELLLAAQKHSMILAAASEEECADWRRTLQQAGLQGLPWGTSTPWPFGIIYDLNRLLRLHLAFTCGVSIEDKPCAA